MTPFSLAGLLIAILALGLGFFVLIRSPDRRLAPAWFLFSLAVGLWGIGIFWIGRTRLPSEGLLAWQVTYALAVIWIAPLFYHFVCVFLGENKRRLIAANYVVGILFLGLLPTRLFFKRADLLFDQFCYIRGGSVYNLFFVWWFGIVIAGHADLLRALKAVSSAKRNQIQYFFLATAIGFTGGFHTYFPKIGIDLYPWGIFGVALYPLIMSYAILRYNLMDIRIFIRRAGLAVLVYSCLLLIVAPLLLFMHQKALSSPGISIGLLGFEVVVLSGILSLGPLLYAYVIRRSSYFHEHEMAGITHDLKSPLGGIQGALDFLENLAEGKAVQGKDIEYLQMARRNAARLEDAVNNLLTIFKIPAKTEMFEGNIHDLGEIVRSVVEELRERVDAKSLKMEISTVNPGPMVHCDEKKIRQVVSNLLVNAVKYTPAGKIDIFIDELDSIVRVTIRDTGEGISLNELPRVFDRLFQGETSRKLRGSGLGLTIAKTWVEAHGGRIGAESDGPGKGSKFWFTLPK